MIPRSRPLCPECETTMMQARITADSSGFDIGIFECPACNPSHPIVAQPVDPMASAKANGWLCGQLQAPT